MLMDYWIRIIYGCLVKLQSWSFKEFMLDYAVQIDQISSFCNSWNELLFTWDNLLIMILSM